MPLVTRSMSAKNQSNIEFTKDPCQVTFESPQSHLPIWRFAIHERYCGQFRPAGTASIFKEFNNNNHKLLSIPTHLVSPLPSDLWHSHIQLYLESTKLLTIHVYYSTGKVLVQGNVCRDWVEQEFDKLRNVVTQLSDTEASSDKVSNALENVMSAPQECDIVPHIAETAEPPLHRDGAPPSTDASCFITDASPLQLCGTTTQPSPHPPSLDSPPSRPSRGTALPSPLPSPSLTEEQTNTSHTTPQPTLSASFTPHTMTPPSPASSGSAPPPPLPPPSLTEEQMGTSCITSQPTLSASLTLLTVSPPSASSPCTTDNTDQASPSLSTSSPLPPADPPSHHPLSSPTPPPPLHSRSSDPSTLSAIPNSHTTSPIANPSTTSPTHHTATPFPFTRPAFLPTSPLPLSVSATMATVLHLQTQLFTATQTISAMHREIQTLKHQLQQTTQQTESNAQNTLNAEVRVKNTIKSFNKDLTQQFQQLHADHTRLECQFKETTKSLQSFKDSQQNINTDIKKQIHTAISNKHTQDSGKGTPKTHTTSSTQVEYTVKTSNKYSVLTDSSTDQDTRTNDQQNAQSSNSTDQQTRTSDAQTQILTYNTNNQPTNLVSPNKPHNKPPPLLKTPSSSSSPNTSTPNATDNEGPPQSSPLTSLMQKTVPRNCDMLLLGDSVSAGLDERQLSPPGHIVKNLSVSGLTVHHLCQWLTSRPPSPHILHVTVHVGINSCDKGPVSVKEWVKLISLLRHAFPSATLQASSILPPLGQHPLREPASRSTAHLRRACFQEGVGYLDNTPSFLARSGAPKKALYHDRLHPSAQGYRVLVRNFLRVHHTQRPSSLLTISTPVDRTSPTDKHEHIQNYNYAKDFPPNTSYNPTSDKVINVLGRHRPTKEKPLRPRQPLITPSPLPDSINNPEQEKYHSDKISNFNHTNTLYHPSHPPQRFSSHTPVHVTSNTPLYHTPFSASSHLPHPTYPQHKPPHITSHPPHPHTAHPPVPAVHTTHTAHPPVPAVHTTSSLHPLAVQLLNTMTAQFLSQQQQGIPLAMPSSVC